MARPTVDGLGRSIFGDVSADELFQWLGRHIRRDLDVDVDHVTFQAGAVGAVFGLRLADGRDVVLKAAQRATDPRRLGAVVAVQNVLTGSGFGAPAVLAGPTVTDGVVAVVEQHLGGPSDGNPHDAATRAAMASALRRQIDTARDLDGSRLIAGRPAWANWDSGAWPTPHIPSFDFSAPVRGCEWIDRLGDDAAGVLRDTRDLRPVIGHSDWVWQNVCFRDSRLVAGYDWESLVFAPESAIVGLVAGAFTQGSVDPPNAPSTYEVAAFIDDYQAAGNSFSAAEIHVARAAATWVRCYNARCQLENLRRRQLDAPGSFVEQLRAEFGH